MNTIRTIELLFLSALVTLMPDSFADGTAHKTIEVLPLENLHTAVKAMMEGKVPLIVDSVILIVAAYASASMRTPAPMIGGAVSCVLFHALIKVFFQ